MFILIRKLGLAGIKPPPKAHPRRLRRGLVGFNRSLSINRRASQCFTSSVSKAVGLLAVKAVEGVRQSTTGVEHCVLLSKLAMRMESIQTTD